MDRCGYIADGANLFNKNIEKVGQDNNNFTIINIENK